MIIILVSLYNRYTVNLYHHNKSSHNIEKKKHGTELHHNRHATYHHNYNENKKIPPKKNLKHNNIFIINLQLIKTIITE